MPLSEARLAATTHAHDYLGAYVADLGSIIDFDAIRRSGLHMGCSTRWVVPACTTGGGLPRLPARPRRDQRNRRSAVAFMAVDRDGKIRMDLSSPCT